VAANEVQKAQFKRGYAWPNPAFPFRVLFEGHKCRVFVIDNLSHNWQWMEKWKNGIRETDFFFIRVGWHQDAAMIANGVAMLDEFGLNKDNFFVLANSDEERRGFMDVGIESEIVNANAWIDTDTMSILNVEKHYDAIYVGRLVAFKRHYLASKVENLAIVAGNAHRPEVVSPPRNIYLNNGPLTQPEVALKINQSKVGLILSESEGACKASSEYLLCGIPVVSTPSTGGRDAWYNEYNSIVCEADEDAIADAVRYFINNPRDPEIIRSDHLAIARGFRRTFIDIFHKVIRRFEEDSVDAESFLEKNRIKNLRLSQKPDFETIFGTSQ